MKENQLKLSQICSYWIFSKGLKDKLETADVNKPSVFEPVKSYYRKNSKIWDTSNNCHNCPKNRKVWCNIALMHPKDADGMANNVDPDQTASSEAVWSWSALFAETYLSQCIEFVRYTLFYFFY